MTGARSVAVALVVALTGCSFALSGPREPVDPHEHCDTESDAPTLDLAGAAVFLGIASAAFISKEAGPSGDPGRTYAALFVGGPSSVIGLVYAVASISGFNKLASCKSARTRQDETPLPHQNAPSQGSAAPATTDSAADRSWQSSHE